MVNGISFNFSLILLFFTRSIKIVAVTLIFIVAFILPLNHGTLGRPRLLRWYLQTCGSAFIKLGQLLAMRYDLLPERYCDELAKLLDKVKPVDFRRIEKVIARDLGKPVSAVFMSINPVPLGSASIAQVHEAMLRSGEAVVVKVMRPGNRGRFYIDLAYLKFMGMIIGQLGLFKNIDVRKVIRELVQLTWEEFDFRKEMQNIQQMHKLMQEDEIDHYAPAVYPSYCGKTIITMEKITGVSVRSLIAAIEEKDDAQLKAWAQRGITPQRTSRVLLRSVLEQCMRHRLFHADPHSANLIVMEKGTLAWVDFGMLGWLDERLWSLQFKLRVAIAEENIHEAYEYLLITLEPLPPIDLSVFEADVKQNFRDWISASRNPAASMLEKSSGYFFLKLFVSIRKAGLSMPLGLTRMYRAIIISDMVMLKLDPDIDWVPVLADFIRDEQQRQIRLMFRSTFSASNLATSLQFFAALPKTALAITNWVQNDMPGFSRSYRQQLSRYEKIILMFLQYFRTVVFIFIALVVMNTFFSVSWLSRWHSFNLFTEKYWGILLIISSLGILFLNKVIFEFKRSAY